MCIVTTVTSLLAVVAPRTGKIIKNGQVIVRNRITKLEFTQTKNKGKE